MIRAKAIMVGFWVKWWFWILPKARIRDYMISRSYMTRYEILILSLFVLLLGVGLGQWWRIAQVEPRERQEMGELVERLKREQRQTRKAITDLEIRLGILEGKNGRKGGVYYGRGSDARSF